jgi:hypothetical protein
MSPNRTVPEIGYLVLLNVSLCGVRLQRALTSFVFHRLQYQLYPIQILDKLSLRCLPRLVFLNKQSTTSLPYKTNRDVPPTKQISAPVLPDILHYPTFHSGTNASLLARACVSFLERRLRRV